MIPTMHLRFVKRRVGANVVRILQQLWQDVQVDEMGEWRDVEMADEGATQRHFPPRGD